MATNKDQQLVQLQQLLAQEREENTALSHRLNQANRVIRLLTPTPEESSRTRLTHQPLLQQLNLDIEEYGFCSRALRDDATTIDCTAQTENIIENILNFDFPVPMPATLPAKLNALTFWERIRLYASIKQDWSYSEGQLTEI